MIMQGVYGGVEGAGASERGGVGGGMWRRVAAEEDTVAARRCDPIDQTRLPHVAAMRPAPLRNLVSAISPAAAPLHFVTFPFLSQQAAAER